MWEEKLESIFAEFIAESTELAQQNKENVVATLLPEANDPSFSSQPLQNDHWYVRANAAHMLAD